MFSSTVFTCFALLACTQHLPNALAFGKRDTPHLNSCLKGLAELAQPLADGERTAKATCIAHACAVNDQNAHLRTKHLLRSTGLLHLLRRSPVVHRGRLPQTARRARTPPALPFSCCLHRLPVRTNQRYWAGGDSLHKVCCTPGLLGGAILRWSSLCSLHLLPPLDLVPTLLSAQHYLEKKFIV